MAAPYHELERNVEALHAGFATLERGMKKLHATHTALSRFNSCFEDVFYSLETHVLCHMPVEPRPASVATSSARAKPSSTAAAPASAKAGKAKAATPASKGVATPADKPVKPRKKMLAPKKLPPKFQKPEHEERLEGILQFLRSKPKGATLAEVASSCDASKTQVNDYLVCLARLGDVIKERGKVVSFHLNPEKHKA